MDNEQLRAHPEQDSASLDYRRNAIKRVATINMAWFSRDITIDDAYYAMHHVVYDAIFNGCGTYFIKALIELFLNPTPADVKHRAMRVCEELDRLMQGGQPSDEEVQS